MTRDKMSKSRKRTRKPLVIACAFAWIAAQAANADTIMLKNSVRLPAGAMAVTLGDIADIDGRDAQQFASLAIVQLNGSASAMEISVQDVRRRLSDAGVHWGRVSLSGRSVTVRPGRPGDAHPPIAMAALAIDAPKSKRDVAGARESATAADLVSEPTIRGEIARLLVPAMHLRPEDIRFAFETVDADVLNTPVNGGGDTRYEIQPLGSVAGDRLPVTIRTWTGGQAGQRRIVTVLPQLLVKAAVLTRDVPSDAMLTSADMESRETWLEPSQAAMALTVVQATGGVLVRSMNAGEAPRANSLRRDALVKRGDITMVRCLVGGVVISMQAEARDDGAQGQTIEFRKPGERESFTATITGRAEAVIDLSKK